MGRVSFTDVSTRRNWLADTGPNGEVAYDPTMIQLGILMRIADAAEKAAHNYDSLLNDRDLWQRRFREVESENRRLKRSNRALRGCISRMKKQAGS